MSDKNSSTIRKPAILAVEGADLLYLILSQIKNKHEYDKIQLFDFGSVESLDTWLSSFSTLSGFSDIHTLGIIRDAEDDADAAKRSVISTLTKFQLSAPDEVLTIKKGKPNVGYLILPHGKSRGCLEDSMISASEGSKLANCAKNFLNCVNDTSRNDNWRAKVQVHAMIAGSSSPHLTLGDSAKTGLWNFQKPELNIILNFATSLNNA